MEDDVVESLTTNVTDPRELYRAARVYAQLGPWMLKSQNGLNEARRTVTRAVELLERALENTPPAERQKFWQEYVRADRFFDGIRAGDGMIALSKKYDPRP